MPLSASQSAGSAPMGSFLVMIIIIAVMFAFMWFSNRKVKQQQSEVQDFRQSLEPGTEVSTNSGLLGTVVSVDLEKEQVVIDSDGSKSRWQLRAITKPPIVPAYVHDDEVDEEGNPLPVKEGEEGEAQGEEKTSQETSSETSEESLGSPDPSDRERTGTPVEGPSQGDADPEQKSQETQD